MKLSLEFICAAAASSYGDFDDVPACDFLPMWAAGGEL